MFKKKLFTLLAATSYLTEIYVDVSVLICRWQHAETITLVTEIKKCVFSFLHASFLASTPPLSLPVVVLYLQAVGTKEWREVS